VTGSIAGILPRRILSADFRESKTRRRSQIRQVIFPML
jgi:hypothetical protein